MISAIAEDHRDDAVNNKSSICHRYMNSASFTSLKPLWYSLQLFGLFFPRVYKEDHFSGNLTLKHGAWRLYATVVLVIIWINALRMFATFNSDDVFGSLLFMKLIMTSFAINCALYCTACYYACHSYDCLPSFFLKLKDCYWDLNLRSAIICIPLAWIGALMAIVAGFYMIWAPGLPDSFSLAPFPADVPYAEVIKVVLSVIQCYTSMIWFLSQAYAYIFCAGLYKIFQLYNKSFRGNLTEQGTFHNNMQMFRLRHQKIVRMVGHCDNFLRIYIAATYITDIATICLILYNMIWDETVTVNAIMFSSYIYWLGLFSVSLVIASIGAALVNHAVSTQWLILCITRFTSKFRESYLPIKLSPPP